MQYNKNITGLLFCILFLVLNSGYVYGGRKKRKEPVKVDFEQIFQAWNQSSLDVSVRYEQFSARDTVTTDCYYMYRDQLLYMKTEQYEQLVDDSLIILIDHQLKQVSIEASGIASNNLSTALNSFSKQMIDNLKNYKQVVETRDKNTIYSFSSTEYAYEKEIPKEAFFYHFNTERSEVTMVEYVKNGVVKVNTKIHPDVLNSVKNAFRILSKDGDWIWLHTAERQRLSYRYTKADGAIPLSRNIILRSGEEGLELTDRFKDYGLLKN